MRPFATALLVAQTLAISVGQVDETADDYVLTCLTDVAGLPDPDFCTPLEAVRADFEGKIETIRNNFDTHVADDAIHSSSTSDDLVVVDSSSSSSSSSHSHSSYRFSFSYDSHSFDLSSDYSFLSSDYSYHFLHDSHSSHSDHHYRPRRKSYAPIRRPRKTVYHEHAHKHTPKQTYHAPAPTPSYKQFDFKYGFKPTSTSYTSPTPVATTHHATHDQYYSEADLVGYITFLESKVKQINSSVSHGYGY